MFKKIVLGLVFLMMILSAASRVIMRMSASKKNMNPTQATAPMRGPIH